MSTPTERFLPDVSRTRRGLGGFFLVVGLAAGAWLLWLLVHSGRRDPGARLAHRPQRARGPTPRLRAGRSRRRLLSRIPHGARGEIEEIVVAGSTEIVGDREILELSPSFCPPAAQVAVARELERRILEVAPR